MSKFGYRKSIIEYLESLSDPNKQISIGPVELINEWFDDLYIPADDPKLYNPGVYEKGVLEFKSCFSTGELSALKKFHQYFESIVDDIDIKIPFSSIQKDSKWIRLEKEALNALKEFN